MILRPDRRVQKRTSGRNHGPGIKFADIGSNGLPSPEGSAVHPRPAESAQGRRR